MRPMVLAGLRQAWRATDTLQIGADPENATVLAGLDPGARDVLRLLDGCRSRAEIVQQATVAGVAPAMVDDLLDTLAGAGVLDDADARLPVVDSEDTSARRRLAPDIDAWTAVPANRQLGPGAGWVVLARRREAHVRVVGADRVGSTVATLLAAAGVGRVSIQDSAEVSLPDASPAGISVAGAAVSSHGAAGAAAPPRRTRAAAAREAVRRVAPEVRVRSDGRTPGLVVLAGSDVGVPAPVAALLASGVPHLPARVVDQHGVVGPLVLPGRTACLRCTELTRADRDPARAQVVAQLDGPRRGPAPCDVVLATATASLAAAQVLAWLDGQGELGTLGRSLELALPDLVPRGRTWLPHPRCGCRELPA